MKPGEQPRLNVEAFLVSVGIRARVRRFRENEIIYSVGDPAKSVFFIREGSVKRTVVSPSGKQGIVGILRPGDFLGTLCLADHPIRIATATAMAPTSLVEIRKQDMVRALHADHILSDRFIAYLLRRGVTIEEDLIDQLFNSSDKRLARVLIRLAHYGKAHKVGTVIPTVSQEMLAEMIGVSRQRINSLMNRFRQLGFIDYNGELRVHRSLSGLFLD